MEALTAYLNGGSSILVIALLIVSIVRQEGIRSAIKDHETRLKRQENRIEWLERRAATVGEK